MAEQEGRHLCSTDEQTTVTERQLLIIFNSIHIHIDAYRLPNARLSLYIHIYVYIRRSEVYIFINIYVHLYIYVHSRRNIYEWVQLYLLGFKKVNEHL